MTPGEAYLHHRQTADRAYRNGEGGAYTVHAALDAQPQGGA